MDTVQDYCVTIQSVCNHGDQRLNGSSSNHLIVLGTKKRKKYRKLKIVILIGMKSNAANGESGISEKKKLNNLNVQCLCSFVSRKAFLISTILISVLIA